MRLNGFGKCTKKVVQALPTRPRHAVPRKDSDTFNIINHRRVKSVIRAEDTTRIGVEYGRINSGNVISSGPETFNNPE